MYDFFVIELKIIVTFAVVVFNKLAKKGIEGSFHRRFSHEKKKCSTFLHTTTIYDTFEKKSVSILLHTRNVCSVSFLLHTRKNETLCILKAVAPSFKNKIKIRPRRSRWYL